MKDKMEHKNKCSLYAPTILRICVGLLFVLPGLLKLVNPSMVQGMLTQIGFPSPMFFTWVLILVEIIGGLMLIVGFKAKYAVWPLVVIMIVAIITTVVPQLVQSPMAVISLLFHLLAIGSLVSIYLSGPGSCSIKA